MASRELTELRHKNQLLQMRLARLRENENERAEIANLQRWIQEAEAEIVKREQGPPDAATAPAVEG